MTDGRAGGTRLLVTTILAAVAVGAVLLIDAYMQDDLQEPIAAIEQPGPAEEPGNDEARLDPRAACWGPFLPRICAPPLHPTPDWEAPAETALNEPVAEEPPPPPERPRRTRLPRIDGEDPHPVALEDRVFAQVIQSWHAPRACATEVGQLSGTPAVRVEMDIDQSGRVKAARATAPDGITEQELATCLETRARSLRFPPEEVRRETTRGATFVF